MFLSQFVDTQQTWQMTEPFPWTQWEHPAQKLQNHHCFSIWNSRKPSRGAFDSGGRFSPGCLRTASLLWFHPCFLNRLSKLPQTLSYCSSQTLWKGSHKLLKFSASVWAVPRSISRAHSHAEDFNRYTAPHRKGTGVGVGTMAQGWEIHLGSGNSRCCLTILTRASQAARSFCNCDKGPSLQLTTPWGSVFYLTHLLLCLHS